VAKKDEKPERGEESKVITVRAKQRGHAPKRLGGVHQIIEKGEVFKWRGKPAKWMEVIEGKEAKKIDKDEQAAHADAADSDTILAGDDD
jgi:hypothetical protein